MAKQRKLMGYKHRVTNPNPPAGQEPLPEGVVDWKLRHENRVVMHQITVIETVGTPDGPMLLVKLKQQADFANPDVDVAVLVGNALVYRKSGKIEPQAPELWFYDEKFWLKAKNSDGSEYYNLQQQYLLYEVQVRDTDKLIEATCTGFEQKEPEPAAE